jgi:hypothetical protein
MGKGKNSGVSSSKKMTEVDEDQVLKVIENKKFLAMRAAASSWPIPSTTEEQLKELADEGLIQDQGLAEWKAPGEHQVPSLNPGEIVLLFLLFTLVYAFQLLFFVNSLVILIFP